MIAILAAVIVVIGIDEVVWATDIGKGSRIAAATTCRALAVGRAEKRIHLGLVLGGWLTVFPRGELQV
ncbi:hypothetical protein D3C78_1741320 [compost metagenome]